MYENHCYKGYNKYTRNRGPKEEVENNVGGGISH